MAIRPLDFALLRLIEQIDELFEVVQCMIQGKLPVKLINPTALHNILRNVSLQLPDGYELLLGTRMDNIYSYYNLISVTLVGDIHCVKIILNIPLKTVNRQFVLYQVIVLRTRISGDKFVMYSIEHWHRRQPALHPFYTSRLESFYCKPHHYLPSEYSSVHRTENDMSLQYIFPEKPQHMLQEVAVPL